MQVQPIDIPTKKFVDFPLNDSPDSTCIFDHAPRGTHRQQYVDLRKSLICAGIDDVSYGMDDVSDDDNDRLIADVASACAEIRKLNKRI